MKKYLALITSIVNSIIIGVFLFASDFSDVVLQWDANNVATTTKAWYFFALLAALSVALAICRIFIEKFANIFSFFVYAIFIYSILAILYNGGYSVSSPFIIMLIIEIGYVIGSIKLRELKFGAKIAINLVYLLDNEKAWYKTQNLASKLGFIVASLSFTVNLLYLLDIFTVGYPFVTLLVSTAIAALIIIRRSYKYVTSTSS